ncbi:MAG: sugar phosphate isomerase/epimerase family protein [Gemmatimonadales bacterium]
MKNGRGERCAVRGMERREFMAMMAGIGVAAAFPRAPRTAYRSRLDRIGLQLYTIRGEMRRDFEGTLARVAEIGYQEVEFAGYFNHAPSAVRALLDRNGLTAPATHVGSIEPDAWRASLEASRVIGHRYIVVPWIPEERRRTLDDYRRVAEDFNRVAAEAKSAGLQFAYHNHDFEFTPLEGRIPFDVLLEHTDPALVQIELDLYWITKGGQDPLSYFARWPGRITLVHVKDSGGAPAHPQVAVGAGTIDFRRIFSHHEQAGIRHYFVEHDEPADPFAFLRKSYEYLRRLEF